MVISSSLVMLLWVECRFCPSVFPLNIFFHTKPEFKTHEGCFMAVPHGDTNPVTPFCLTEFLNHEEQEKNNTHITDLKL